MNQKYKIFINDKVVFLVDNPAKVSEILTSPIPYIIQPFKNGKNLDRLLGILLGDFNNSFMVIYHSKVEELKQALFSKFVFIEAAGGVVRNNFGQILLIYRRGFWDLPKGKIESGESSEVAAQREVIEETGISSVKVYNLITFEDLQNKSTFHTYFEKGKHILKATYWYNMLTDHTEVLIPQTEEDIEEVIWVNEKDLSKFLSKMYPSIVDVLKSTKLTEINLE